MSVLLTVDTLRVSLPTATGSVQAVRDVSFSLEAGQTLALVGESGSGKSLCALSLMGLLPAGAELGGRIDWRGAELNAMSEAQWRALRGREMALVAQNPMSALNPTMTVGDQIAEVLRLHRALSAQQARQAAERLLDRMAIAQAGRRLRQYPHEFSGGMLQRVAIAMAMAGEPRLLIADEPTTALDVTVQDQVLQLLSDLQRESNMALLLISHDLAVVARMADQVAVMYAGQLLEQAAVEQLYNDPRHPYTRALLAALPGLDSRRALVALPGSPPSLSGAAPGCAFAPRCARAMRVCLQRPPELLSDNSGRACRCWLQHPLAAAQGVSHG